MTIEIKSGTSLTGDPFFGHLPIPSHCRPPILTQQFQLPEQRPHFLDSIQAQQFSPGGS